MNIFLFRLGALLCLFAVALGAFGAHALKERLQLHDLTGVWEKAVLYHFLHAIALLALSVIPNLNRAAPILLLAGIVIFSGSLYIMALSNLRWLGAITPIGGLCFLAGWLWLVVSPTR